MPTREQHRFAERRMVEQALAKAEGREVRAEPPLDMALPERLAAIEIRLAEMERALATILSIMEAQYEREVKQ